MAHNGPIEMSYLCVKMLLRRHDDRNIFIIAYPYFQ